jgi:hypothetical protein
MYGSWVQYFAAVGLLAEVQIIVYYYYYFVKLLCSRGMLPINLVQLVLVPDTATSHTVDISVKNVSCKVCKVPGFSILLLVGKPQFKL